MKIMIVGLNKADVLLALYNNAHCEGPAMSHAPMMKMMSRMMPPATIETAQKEIDARFKSHNFHFDYVDLGGGPKSLKLDLSGFEFDSSQYDEYHGKDLAEKVINSLRTQYTSALKDAPKQSFAGLLAAVNTTFTHKASEESKQRSEEEAGASFIHAPGGPSGSKL
jgi:hypothetical protein